MAQDVCEKPLALVEAEVSQKNDDLAMVSATANRAAKSSDDLAATGTEKANGDLISIKANAASDNVEKKNRIQVSNTKKPFFFYLNLAKRYIKQYNEVELSALGMAIPTVVTIAEILKVNGFAVERKVLTSTVGSKDENKGRLVQKAKLEIVLEKNHAAKDSDDSKLEEAEHKEE